VSKGGPKYRNDEKAYTPKSSGIGRRDTKANLVPPPNAHPTVQASSKIIQLPRNAVMGYWPAPLRGKKPHSDKTYQDLAPPVDFVTHCDELLLAIIEKLPHLTQCNLFGDI
jgi:hypothetical protein